MVKVMLCGAGDVSELLPEFEKASIEMNFEPLNFINGNILYHNYGTNKWERNSKETVRTSDIVIFVINENYGEITWNTEMKEALNSGKNFIILCRDETYKGYRFFKDQRLEYPPNLDSHKKSLYLLLNKFENDFQLTIATFSLFGFRLALKDHIMNLFMNAIKITEKENQKNNLLPILMSSQYISILKNYINEENDKICKRIVFDFFENKEIRKRALEYFKYSKVLTDEEIVELCTDTEQGVKRKSITILPDILSAKNDLNTIFRTVISNIAHDDDVGTIRRAIKTFISISLEMSIEYFNLFLPANDVGTPRRIISYLKEYENDLDRILVANQNLKLKLINLIKSCVEFNTDKSDWKISANTLLTKYL